MLKKFAGRFKLLFEELRLIFVDNSDGWASGRRHLLTGNLAGGVVANLSGGLFFTGLMLILLKNMPKAYSDNYIGLVGVVTTACGLIQLFSPLVLEKIPRRKPLLLGLRIIYHIINIFFIALIPLMPISRDHRLFVLIGAIIVMNLITSASAPGFSIWHIACLTEEKRPDYFSISNMISPIISTLTVLAASTFLDGYKAAGAELTGNYILRAVSIPFAIIEMLMYLGIKEPEYHSSEGGINLKKMLTNPWKTPKYLISVSIAFIWTFSASIMGSYYTVYLLDKVGLSYTYMSFAGAFNIPIILIFTPVWAMIIKKRNWFKTLDKAVFLYAFAYIINLLIVKQTAWMYIVVVIFCNAIAPGINLVFSNIPYMNIPPKDQTNYLSFYSTMAALAGLAGNYIGRTFIMATEDKTIRIFGYAMENRQYMNILPFVFMIALVAFIGFADRYLQKTKEKETQTEEQA